MRKCKSGMICAPEGVPGQRQSWGRFVPSGIPPVPSKIHPVSRNPPGRVGQQRGWVQQCCKLWAGEIPAKHNPGMLGHGRISPAARDVSDHSEQDHSPSPLGQRLGAAVPSQAHGGRCSILGRDSSGSAVQECCCTSSQGLGECWVSLSHPQPPRGVCPQEKSQGLPSLTPLAQPPAQHIRDAGRILLTFRDHSLEVTPSLLPQDSSSAWMRCPRAVAAPTGGTRCNRGSFICVFPAKPGGSCVIQGQCPGWIQPGSSSAQAVASPRERGRLGTALKTRELVTQEIQRPAASRMLAQGFLIQVPVGLLGQVGQTDRQRQSWELQKSHVWLLFHFY